MNEELMAAFNTLTIEKQKEVEDFIFCLKNEVEVNSKTCVQDRKISLEELESFCTDTNSVPPNFDAQEYISQLRADRVL